MAQRATVAVAEWVSTHPDGVVAVVSHGDVIKAILSDALGQPLDAFQRIVVGPGSLSVVRYDAGAGHGAADERHRPLDPCAHLRGAPDRRWGDGMRAPDPNRCAHARAAPSEPG